MFIYRNFLLSLLKGEINLSSDYFEAEIYNDVFEPSNDDNYENTKCYSLDIPTRQVIFKPFIKENDNSLYININPIHWEDITGNSKGIIIRKDNLLIGWFEFPNLKHFDHSSFDWSFDSYCLKFSS